MYDECEDCGHYDCQCKAVTGPAQGWKHNANCLCDECCPDLMQKREAERTAADLATIWERAYFAYAAAGESIESCKEFAGLTVASWPFDRDALIRGVIKS